MAKEKILHDKPGNEIYPITGSQQVFRNGTTKTVEQTLAELEGRESGIPDAPSDGKTYGRKNGAWSEVTGGGSSDAVLYTPQELTEDEQKQARVNIGAESKENAYNIARVVNLSPFVLKWQFSNPAYYKPCDIQHLLIKDTYIYASKNLGTLGGGIQKFDFAGNSLARDNNDWFSNQFLQSFLVKGDFLYGIRNNNSIVKLNVSDLTTHSKVSYSFSGRYAIYQLAEKIVVFNNESIYVLNEDTLDLELIDTISDVQFAYIGANRKNLIIVTSTTMYEYDENFQVLNQRVLPDNFNGDNIKWAAVRPLAEIDEGIIILNTLNKITYVYLSFSNPSDTGLQIPNEYVTNRIYEVSDVFLVKPGFDTAYILTDNGFLLETIGNVGNVTGIRKVIPLSYDVRANAGSTGGNSERTAIGCSINNTILL